MKEIALGGTNTDCIMNYKTIFNKPDKIIAFP